MALSDTGDRQETRAQAGIGTLIILIAALLVASIAVGVFFETTGFLSGKTTATSDDVSDQLNGRLEIVAVTGKVHDGTVEVVNITVKTASNGVVDLRNATIQWVGPSDATTLVWAGKNREGPNFGITKVSGSGTDRILDSESDRATITIDPGTAINATTTIDGQTVDIVETGPALEENDVVAVDIITDSTTSYRIRVDGSLEGRSRISL